jgi:DUF1009 family protein
MTIAAPKLGIIAGGGDAPRQLIAACRRNGRPFFVIALEGQADAGLAEDAPHVVLGLGAGEKLKKTLAEQEIAEVVMIGRVRRPSLAELRPDWLALKLLTKIGFKSLGDDGLLRGIGTAIEDEMGVRVIGAHEVFEELLAPHGLLTARAPDAEDEADIARGITVATALGVCDVGQAVVVQRGLVLGVEAVEGTDALIARAATLKRAGGGGVLVKRAKPQQDRRFDLPSIGPATIEALAAGGFGGVVVQADASLIVERTATVALADAKGLFIVGASMDEVLS